MDVAMISKWVDEVQAQVDDLRRKVNKPAPADKDVTPFLDLANKDYITIEADAEVVLTYDCFVLVDTPTTLAISPSETAHAFTPIPTRCCYAKKGQVIKLELGISSESGTYSLIPLFGGEQPPATNSRTTRKTKK